MGPEKDEDMRRIARDCRDALMRSGPQDELELKFIDWCTDACIESGVETSYLDEYPYL